MTPSFFPDIIFGWAFVLCLAAFLVCASVTDLRFTVIPKAITLTAIPCGIIFNIARLAWLAHKSEPTWVLATGNAWIGALDGLLFALTGFGLCFAIFFAFWMLGVCGGGDVKLFAALGAWTGIKLAIYVLCVTLVLLSVLVLSQSLFLILTGDFKRLRNRPRKGQPAKPTRRLITFALPLTLSTVLVLAWTFRSELKLLPTPPAVALEYGDSHAI